MVNLSKYNELVAQLAPKEVTLVAVSKLKSTADIMKLYQAGQRDFGENYVQELVEKQAQLPADIRWHFIGHLQGNKVKYIAPFVHLIHGVDSIKLLKEVDKQAAKNKRVINVLLQVHIAQEETKFGLDEQELEALLTDEFPRQMQHVRIMGLMGMASFSENETLVRGEFRKLKALFEKHAPFGGQSNTHHHLSMGMSNDYELAIAEGSNMVRIGSLLFGAR